MIEQIIGKSQTHSLKLFTNEEIDWLEGRIFTRQMKRGEEFAVKCFVREKEIKLTPEEVVRQLYAHRLVEDYDYPVSRLAFELKSPLPNSDQTKVSKEKILKLLAMMPPVVDGAFYALVYNPYGASKADYAWPFPSRWFNMQSDAAVLIGEEFWDMIGGLGAYKQFINEINKLGREYRERIYREYLGIEPPDNALHNELR